MENNIIEKDFEVLIPHLSKETTSKYKKEILSGLDYEAIFNSNTLIKCSRFRRSNWYYNDGRFQYDNDGCQILFSYGKTENIFDEKTLSFKIWSMEDREGLFGSIRKIFVRKIPNTEVKNSFIIPIIQLSDKMFKELTKELIYGDPYLELGKYPDCMYTNRKLMFLEPTGKKYRFPIVKNKNDSVNEIQEGNEYDRFGVKIAEYYNPYSTIRERKEGRGSIYYTVKNIKWKIDWYKRRLIATEPLLVDVGYSKDGSECAFKDSYLYKFLNEEFLQDAILQHLDTKKMELYKETENKNEEISSVINEIKHYSKIYRGPENIEDIVKNIINKYNSDINSLKESNGLVLYTEDGLRTKLIYDLNTILNRLKSHMEANKEYYEILKFIDNCISLVNDNKIIECNSELYKDLITLCKEILPKLSRNKNKIMEIQNRLISLLSNDKEEIIKYLQNDRSLNDDINLKVEDTGLNYRNLEEYEIQFRINFHPILERVSSISKEEEKQILIEQKNRMLDSVNIIYENARNKKAL